MMPKLTDRALELGLYLPLGAYTRAREGMSDLTSTRVRKLVDELVDRGEERTQVLTKVVRRRANRAEDVAAKTSAKVQRETTKTVKKTVKKASAATAPATAKLPRVAAPKTASELPIASYNSLTASEILTELKGLTQTQLAKVYKFEKANEGRATILEAIDSRLTPLPIPTFDALTVDEIAGRLGSLDESQLKTLRRYETDTKNRSTVLEKINTHL
jgi:polyhydroxyalkanoate synthesis regulator phasin